MHIEAVGVLGIPVVQVENVYLQQRWHLYIVHEYGKKSAFLFVVVIISRPPHRISEQENQKTRTNKSAFRKTRLRLRQQVRFVSVKAERPLPSIIT